MSCGLLPGGICPPPPANGRTITDLGSCKIFCSTGESQEKEVAVECYDADRFRKYWFIIVTVYQNVKLLMLKISTSTKIKYGWLLKGVGWGILKQTVCLFLS